MSRRDAALASALARWIAVRPLGARIARLAGGPVRVTSWRVDGSSTRDRSAPGALAAATVIGRPSAERAAVAASAPRPGIDHGAPGVAVAARGSIDPHAARADVRVRGLSIVVSGASMPVRALAQRLLGGPAELEAPRPLTIAEHAIWALAIAAVIEDLAIDAEVWPLADADGDGAGDAITVELVLDVHGTPMTVVARCPHDLELRVPSARELPAWSFEVPVILGACAIPRDSLTRLAVRDVVTLEGSLSLRIGSGTIGLTAAPGAVEAELTTGYVARDMALPDQAHVELTVQLGTLRLTLRQLAELAPGAIVQLGRPLAGPFEVRAAGRLIGQGELVDVDGELGVRIVSLQE